jgi:hypothetical protein
MKAHLETRRVFVDILAIGLFAMAARAVIDPDVWWHLRTGQLILQNRAVFHADPYSFTRFGQPWINHEWLSDLLIFGLYRTWGTGALTVAFAGMAAGAFLLVFARSAGKPYLAGLVTVWGACASAPSWGARPQIISLLLTSFFLWVLDRSESKARLLWWTVPFTALWVNLHAEFALGIALIALFLLGNLLDTGFGFEPWARVAPRVRSLSLALAGCLAVVPLNPYGVRMYFYPLQTLSSPAMAEYIQEWASPDFHGEMYLPFLLMVMALVAAAAISPLRLRARDLLLLIAMLWAALHSVRHIPLFALVAAPVLAALIRSILQERGMRLRTSQVQPGIAKLALNGLLLASFVAFEVIWVSSVIWRQNQAEAKAFPVQAVHFLEQNQPPGPLLNNYNWGGYLIWRLYPENRVYIDGRADLYGDSFMDSFAATYGLTGHWETPLQSWHIRTVILPPASALATVLRSRKDWKLIYSDSQAVVLTHASTIE